MVEVNIWPFDLNKDMEGALQCFNEGFENIRWPHIRHAKPGFHKDTSRYFNKMSTDHFVAEAEGEICGVIFGAVPLQVKK